MRHRRIHSALTLALCLLFATPSAAALEIGPEIPDALRPWTGWVLRGHEQRACPFFSGQNERTPRGCVWPSQLSLDVDEQGGRFTQRWRLHAEAQVPLPGDARRWPEDLRLDGKPAPVADRGAPVVTLSAGDHLLTGRFRWKALPELLQIPRQTGIVRLSIQGRVVPIPNRDAEGRLWLRKRANDDASEASRVEVVVHRHVADEVPLRLETRIELRVSGASREVVLGRALPDGFIPMSLSSPLPARLDPDGRLRVQVRPGTWSLGIAARHDGPAESLAPPEQHPSDEEGFWDASEVWVFDARPHLRRVDVEGAALVDPSQTTLPSDWQHLPAYLMERGTTLRLVERLRGDADPAPDRLDLAREWWLDFDGGGYTIRDIIEGDVRRGTRLQMGSGVTLGRAALDGRDQVITRVPGSDAEGIEIPRGKIALLADSRIEDREPGSAVSWDHDFRSLSGTLHLPPGWRLFHATGVDSASQTWITRWTLLDLFFVLVIAMAFFRLWGPVWGGLALVALAVTYTEPGAPQLAWVAALVGEALIRARAAARFERVVQIYRGVALATLVLIAIPFAVREVRIGFYPALDRHGLAVAVEQALSGNKDVEDKLATMEVDELGDEEARRFPATQEATVAGPSRGRRSLAAASGSLAFAKSPYAYAPDPRAQITTGPGLPTWGWHRVLLEWSGPVERGQPMGLLLLPPLANLVLAFVRLALVSLLALRILWGSWNQVGPWLRGRGSRSAAAAAAAALVLGTFVSAPPARADIPDPQILSELRDHLLKTPECFPSCASVSRMRIDASPAALQLRLTVDVVATSAIPLPGGLRSWTPDVVLVDATPDAALMRASDGTLWLQVEVGRHQIVARGPLASRDSIDLALPLRPHRVEATVDGWVLHGLHDDGLVESTLQLTRVRDESGPQGATLDPGELPAFVHVVRELHLGLDWKLQTAIARVTPGQSAVVLVVPLLEGESVTSENVRVRDGNALVSMAPGTRRVSWSSDLEIRPELHLRAPESGPWSEAWRLDVSPIWHVESDGIPPIHQPSSRAARTREWRPWPGEEVVLAISRPEGVEGATLTIDASRLSLRPGLRSTDASLEMRLRSSRGGQHAITLPEGATLQRVEIHGSVVPIRPEGRLVTLPLRPGSQLAKLQWQEPRGTKDASIYATSAVDLGAPSVNSELEIHPPDGRWILYTGGPRLGPAVLFWPKLLVLALLAVVLGRVRTTPLRARHWFLLGIGLTQISVALGSVVVAWLLLLGWRREGGRVLSNNRFALAQLLIALLTVAALGTLFVAIQQGLLGRPDMQIAGNGSGGQLLRWYQDRIGMQPEAGWMLSVPLLAYRIAMLAWALWIAQALVSWLRWGWQSYTEGGLWRSLQRPGRKKPRGKGEVSSQSVTLGDDEGPPS